MKKIREKVEAMLTGITFAEVGETETALSFLDSGIQTEKDVPVGRKEKPAIHGSKEAAVSKFQRSMSAVAFAESGEFQSAREVLHLSPRPATVALVIDNSNPNLNAIDYTINLCKRIGATMDVLITEPGKKEIFHERSDAERVLDSTGVQKLVLFLEQKDVQWKMHMLDGDIVENLEDYIRRHKRVTSVVYDSPTVPRKGQKVDSSWYRILDAICMKLSIPLITVFDKHPSRAVFGAT